MALLEGPFLIVCVKLGAEHILENYQHSFHKIHAFYQHLARPENDQSLFPLSTKTRPRLPPPPPHRDIQGSGPLVYFLCMNVIGISMFMLKLKGMYIMNEFLYYENEHRAFENFECDLDFFLSFYHAFICVEEECHDVSNKSPKKSLLDLVTTVCACPF